MLAPVTPMTVNQGTKGVVIDKETLNRLLLQIGSGKPDFIPVWSQMFQS
jgi:hypothetical protein